jgi:mono/diheme cytochrome c family protein
VLTSPANTNTSAQAQQSFQGFVTRIPITLDREAINRGEERFNVYCSLCHGRAGDGKGMIALRGFRRDQMPSFHQDRLRTAPPGYFFDVMTAGLGTMPSYAGSISAEDRWKIVAYIRALQMSQGARVSDLPPELQQKLNNPQPSQGGQQGAH